MKKDGLVVATDVVGVELERNTPKEKLVHARDRYASLRNLLSNLQSYDSALISLEAIWPGIPAVKSSMRICSLLKYWRTSEYFYRTKREGGKVRIWKSFLKNVSDSE